MPITIETLRVKRNAGTGNKVISDELKALRENAGETKKERKEKREKYNKCEERYILSILYINLNIRWIKLHASLRLA